jgi:hypothetical protein
METKWNDQGDMMKGSHEVDAGRCHEMGDDGVE